MPELNPTCQTASNRIGFHPGAADSDWCTPKIKKNFFLIFSYHPDSERLKTKNPEKFLCLNIQRMLFSFLSVYSPSEREWPRVLYFPANKVHLRDGAPDWMNQQHEMKIDRY